MMVLTHANIDFAVCDQQDDFEGPLYSLTWVRSSLNSSIHNTEFYRYEADQL